VAVARESEVAPGRAQIGADAYGFPASARKETPPASPARLKWNSGM